VFKTIYAIQDIYNVPYGPRREEQTRYAINWALRDGLVTEEEFNEMLTLFGRGWL